MMKKKKSILSFYILLLCLISGKFSGKVDHGSGLHRIFHTWETVFHCKPSMESTASGGVDRTVLRLSFEGHQPHTEAMRRLYDDHEAITFKKSIRENKRNGESGPQSHIKKPV
jgi:hypothetical protein